MVVFHTNCVGKLMGEHSGRMFFHCYLPIIGVCLYPLTIYCRFPVPPWPIPPIRCGTWPLPAFGPSNRGNQSYWALGVLVHGDWWALIDNTEHLDLLL